MTARRTIVAAALAGLLAAPAVRAQTLRTLSSSRQLHGERALDVDVTYVAGRFRLVPAAPGTLYQMEMRTTRTSSRRSASTTRRAARYGWASGPSGT